MVDPSPHGLAGVHRHMCRDNGDRQQQEHSKASTALRNARPEGAHRLLNAGREAPWDQWLPVLGDPTRLAAPVLENYVLAAKRVAVQPEAVGILHKSLKANPVPPSELEVGDHTLVHTADLMGHKAVTFKKLWAPRPPDAGEIGELFRIVREAAQCEALPELTPDLVYASAKAIKAKAGLGVDVLSPVDFQRLPLGAMIDFTDILGSAGA
eukprot:4512053-Pyramimonas_sp.AAC.1